MAEYQTYRDINGVEWTIITGARQMFATVKDETEPRYDPPPPDQGPVPRGLTPIGADATAAEVAEIDRVAFVKLRVLIDKYAADNRQHVILRVTASQVPWWAWVAGALLLFGGKRRKR